MKKFFALVLAAVVTLSLAACTSSGASGGASSTVSGTQSIDAKSGAGQSGEPLKIGICVASWTSNPIFIDAGNRLRELAKEKGYDTSAKGNLGKFVDSNKISDYALEAMRWATGMEIINGTSENTLDAFEDSTRAQVATMLMNFVKNIK